MRFAGIDPGTIRCGYGIVEVDGTRVVHVASGVIHAPEKQPLEQRLLLVHRGLAAVLDEHRPASVGLEDVFVGKHVSAALALGHARGVVMLAVTERGLPLASYPASVVKRTVVGRGAADKEQVARLLGAMLGLRELPGIDATDALAVAITHANASRMRDVVLRASPRRR